MHEDYTLSTKKLVPTDNNDNEEIEAKDEWEVDDSLKLLCYTI